MAEVVIMGGAMGLGNTGPVMEFNIQTDPEAAAIVFDAGWPLVMVPIEVTHTALVTPDVLERIHRKDSPFCTLVCRLLTFFRDTYREVFHFDHPPLHDPCVVAYCIAPNIFEVKKMRVDIETSSQLSAGQTVCDVWGQSGRPPNASVAVRMDVAEFWDMMVAAIHAADEASSLNAPTAGSRG
uniref:Purine nucleosidase n=2 Tax=Tetraselmis sp. GSL018 TaxID=582737 RepID=A0A061SMB8_9CHLO